MAWVYIPSLWVQCLPSTFFPEFRENLLETFQTKLLFHLFQPFFSIQGRLGSPCGSRVQVIPGHRRCCATFCAALELTEFPTRSIDSDRSYRSGLNSLGLEVGCSKGRDWITLGGTLNSPLKQSSRCLMLEYAHRFSFQNPRLLFYKCWVSKKSISKHENSPIVMPKWSLDVP